MKRGNKFNTIGGFSVVEVMIAIAVLTVAMIATLDFSTMLARQQVMLDSKNENIANAKLVEATFESTLPAVSHPITLTFGNGAASYGKLVGAPMETYMIRKEGGALLFPADNVRLQLASISDFQLANLNPSDLQPGSLWGMFKRWSFPNAFAAGGPTYTIAPPPTGVVQANFNVVADVMGRTAKQIIRQNIAVYFTFTQMLGGSDWSVLHGYPRSLIDSEKEKCEQAGTAYEFAIQYNAAGTQSEMVCKSRDCPDGQFLSDDCVLVQPGATPNTPAANVCVSAGLFQQNTVIGREEACSNRNTGGSVYHSRRYDYISPGGGYCPEGYSFNKEIIACDPL